MLRRRRLRRNEAQTKAKSIVQTSLFAMGSEDRKGNEAAVASVLGEAMDAKHQRTERRTKHRDVRNAQEVI